MPFQCWVITKNADIILIFSKINPAPQRSKWGRGSQLPVFSPEANIVGMHEIKISRSLHQSQSPPYLEYSVLISTKTPSTIVIQRHISNNRKGNAATLWHVRIVYIAFLQFLMKFKIFAIVPVTNWNYIFQCVSEYGRNRLLSWAQNGLR